MLSDKIKIIDLPKIIDYLTIDIEGNGQRFQALTKIIDSGYNFKIITIERQLLPTKSR